MIGECGGRSQAVGVRHLKSGRVVDVSRASWISSDATGAAHTACVEGSRRRKRGPAICALRGEARSRPGSVCRMYVLCCGVVWCDCRSRQMQGSTNNHGTRILSNSCLVKQQTFRSLFLRNGRPDVTRMTTTTFGESEVCTLAGGALGERGVQTSLSTKGQHQLRDRPVVHAPWPLTPHHANVQLPPPFHHSTIPPFHHSTIPPFHHSTIPSLHRHSAFGKVIST
jgi:hypothetical protein